MEELIGPIIFCWVACGVNLVALIEVICALFVSQLPIFFSFSRMATFIFPFFGGRGEEFEINLIQTNY